MIRGEEVPDCKVERTMDPHTGKITTLYRTTAGEEVRHVVLSGRIAKRYAGLTMIARDLENALQWAQKAESMIDQLGSPSKYNDLTDRALGDEIKCLFIASLSFYGKSFTDAEGRGVRLHRQNLDQEFVPAHEFFMAYRHNLAAHSGSGRLEFATPHLLLAIHDRGLKFRLVVERTQTDFAMGGTKVRRLSALIEHVIAKVDKMQDANGATMMKAAKGRSAEFWIRSSGPHAAPVDMDPIVKANG